MLDRGRPLLPDTLSTATSPTPSNAGGGVGLRVCWDEVRRD